MLTFEEIDSRNYSGLDIPSIKDVAIALIHWSQYNWYSLEEYQVDLSVLDLIRSHFPPITCGLSNLYRGIWLNESDVKHLLSGNSVILKPGNSWFPAECQKYESWATSFESALRFSIRSRTGYSAVLKKSIRDLEVAWVARQLCNMIPEEITSRYPDLKDLEDEVVVEKQIGCEISTNDIAVMYGGTEVIYSG